MAEFVGNTASSRGKATSETSNGLTRTRITETDASRPDCEPPVPRVRPVSFDRSRCLRSAGTGCNPQVWVSEVFSDVGSARTSGVSGGDIQVTDRLEERSRGAGNRSVSGMIRLISKHYASSCSRSTPWIKCLRASACACDEPVTSIVANRRLSSAPSLAIA